MKNSILILFTLLISAVSISQNGFNYKAVIKDANDDLIVNQQVGVQFKILEDATTLVYEEIQAATTSANGIIVVNIGEGATISGDFDAIDWGAADHFLNIQLNTGTGFVDLGTTQFKSVPYAKTAEVATTVKNSPILEFDLVKVRAPSTGTLIGKIPFSSESFDLNNSFDTTQHRFTATEDGYYRVQAKATASASNFTPSTFNIFSFSLQLFKSSSSLGVSSVYTDRLTEDANFHRNTLSLSSIEYLSAGEYIEINGSSSSIINNIYDIYLEVERIR